MPENSTDSLRFTKIVATVAGNNTSREFLEELFNEGMDVMRLNSAHMTIGEMENMISMARSVSPYLAVMLDTKGPNIRTCGVGEQGISLKKGETVRISGTSRAPGTIGVNYSPFVQEVPSGSRIICDDGAARFRVVEKQEDALIAEALFDCTVHDRKSINVPDVSLKAPALSEKDRLFLEAAVRLKCDLIAHSFVRNAEDVREVRRTLGKEGAEIGIIAKIENREGVEHIHEILQEADGIMVARGDLGIEIPLEEVPAIQKKLIHEARKFAKPVITATQMLQSMENAPSPTRAEVSDVANAVYDGTDAVMLSGETAHGRYPRESIAMMSRIVREAEQAPRQFFPQLTETPDCDKESAFVLASAVRATELLPVRAVICCSLRGLSARVCSALRPRVPLFVPTPSEITMRKLALSYGVFSTICEYTDSPALLAHASLKLLLKNASKVTGDELLAVLGKNSASVRRNNLLCLASVKELQQKK